MQPDRDAVKSIVYDLAFRPDGTQIVAAVGNRVLVYDAADGDLLHSLKGAVTGSSIWHQSVVVSQDIRTPCIPWPIPEMANASHLAGDHSATAW